jgi:Electron transfer DM13
MRHPFSIIISAVVLVGLFLSACGKDEQSTPPDNPGFKGDFVSAAHSTKGIATIDSNEATLTLTNFKTDSGPDLNIYIVSNINNVTSDFIDLGDIKGRNGNYTYTLPGNKDYTVYKYVVVWCVDFDVNFGYAELIEQ